LLSQKLKKNPFKNSGKCGIPKNAKKVVVLKVWVVCFKSNLKKTLAGWRRGSALGS